MAEHAVVVAGAGPTGLTLAVALALTGSDNLRTLCLDRWIDRWIGSHWDGGACRVDVHDLG
ncbi:hypothetical protein [Mycobacterium attenuatum]|uniref:FAD-binding domain-containing protein n=1 Tax=Mycobacterium attenuatum TaxID=2341086 RepID=A0A498Q564_9MYCO|nr:hypothetical protein [Mycobacterium attenuatum]VBA39505.1 hypothetical protein LAUMK136_03029 [Mycobacterium attenuatum]VBA54042.1 hypothetical protein LAUMK191_03001 [Mycobacterium attenuatum]VBA58626.1 hypothetical protein LAUMK41_03078 [Mycobacterium attenuatum]